MVWLYARFSQSGIEENPAAILAQYCVLRSGRSGAGADTHDDPERDFAECAGRCGVVYADAHV